MGNAMVESVLTCPLCNGKVEHRKEGPLSQCVACGAHEMMSGKWVRPEEWLKAELERVFFESRKAAQVPVDIILSPEYWTVFHEIDSGLGNGGPLTFFGVNVREDPGQEKPFVYVFETCQNCRHCLVVNKRIGDTYFAESLMCSYSGFARDMSLNFWTHGTPTWCPLKK